VGPWTITREDVVVADDDGVIFLPADRADEVFSAAGAIRDTEVGQAERMRAGQSLRDQLRFADYLRRRAEDPQLTLRRHLAEIGGAIEV
jgi:regulator of RNase E activity RraA